MRDDRLRNRESVQAIKYVTPRRIAQAMSDGGGGDRIEGNPSPPDEKDAKGAERAGQERHPVVETKMEDVGSRKRGLGTFGA